MFNKRLVLTFLMIFGFIFGSISVTTAATEVAKKYASVSVAKAALKKAPASNAKNLAVLNKGTKLDIVNNTNKYWLKVKVKNKVGYINRKSLVMVQPVVKKPVVKKPVATAKPAIKQSSKPKPLKLTLGGGSIGGAWSAVGEAIGESIKREIPGSIFAYEPGVEAANLVQVNEKAMQLALSFDVFCWAAQRGEKEFWDRAPLKNLRAIAGLYHDAAENIIINTATININSLAEIKEKKLPVRISVSQKGSFMEVLSKKTLEAYGITYKDIESYGGHLIYLPLNATFDMMADKRLDVMVSPTSPGASQIVQAALNTPLKLLSASDEVINKMTKEINTIEFVIPANSYSFQKNDIKTFAVGGVLVTNNSMSDDDAYAIAKAMYNQLKYLKTAHAFLSALDPKGMALTGGVPLHPGAEKFYKELGLIK